MTDDELLDELNSLTPEERIQRIAELVRDAEAKRAHADRLEKYKRERQRPN